jgi:hypothetical protein
LIYGDTQFLLTEEDQWAYLRSWFGESTLIVFNKSDKPSKSTIKLPSSIKGRAKALIQNGSTIKKTNEVIHVELVPRSYEIILIQK